MMSVTETASHGMRKESLCAVLVAGLIFAHPAMAGELTGHKVVRLISNEGERLTIGAVDFTPRPGGSDFKLTFDRAAFAELYMEETNFLCLADHSKQICHFPFPPGDYAPDDSAGFVADGDLRPLEYALLFVNKRRNDVDIDPFNGLYYRLEVNGGHLEGVVNAVDLRPLSVGGRGDKYPLQGNDLDAIRPEEQIYPRIVIE